MMEATLDMLKLPDEFDDCVVPSDSLEVYLHGNLLFVKADEWETMTCRKICEVSNDVEFIGEIVDEHGRYSVYRVPFSTVVTFSVIYETLSRMLVHDYEIKVDLRKKRLIIV